MEQLKEEKMMAEKSKFEEELEKLNINLTEHQKEQFDRYYEMLVVYVPCFHILSRSVRPHFSSKHTSFLERTTMRFTYSLNRSSSNF